MRNETQEEIANKMHESLVELKRLSADGVGRTIYKILIKDAVDLASRVSNHKSTQGFDKFVEEHNRLLLIYIGGFKHFITEERENGALFLGQVKSYLNGVLDVYRVREMREYSDHRSKKR